MEQRGREWRDGNRGDVVRYEVKQGVTRAGGVEERRGW